MTKIISNPPRIYIDTKITKVLFDMRFTFLEKTQFLEIKNEFNRHEKYHKTEPKVIEEIKL